LDLVAARRNALAARKAIERLGSEATVEFVLDVDGETNTYEEWLRGHLSAIGITVVPTPEVSHDDVVQRAIHRHRPFTESGKGYQDTLVWLTALDLVTDDAPVALISHDQVAFRQSKESDDLHDSLAKDLDARGFAKGAITVFRDVGAFIKVEIEPRQELLREVQAHFAQPDVLEQLRSMISDVLNGTRPSLSVSGRMDGSAEVEAVYKTDYVNVHDAFLGTDTEVVVSIEADTEIDVAYDIRDLDGYLSGSATVMALVEAEASFDRDSKELSDLYISSASVGLDFEVGR
jgi:hypothetical protein